MDIFDVVNYFSPINSHSLFLINWRKRPQAITPLLILGSLNNRTVGRTPANIGSFVVTVTKLFILEVFKVLVTALDKSFIYLTLLWRRSLSCRNQFIDLLCKSKDWFLHEIDKVNKNSYFTLTYMIHEKLQEHHVHVYWINLSLHLIIEGSYLLNT